MLVLARKSGESIRISDVTEVKILSINGDTVKIGITAPLSVSIWRSELYDAVAAGNKAASHAPLSRSNINLILSKLEKKNEEES